MTARIIDGKAFAAGLRSRTKNAVAALKTRHNLTIGLTVVLVGEDPASKIYVKGKGVAAREAGLVSNEIRLPDSISEAELLGIVDGLNRDPSVHGILVQFPVPPHIRQQAVLDALSPDKDVDGLTTRSTGRLLSGYQGLVSCTPQGCLMLIKDQRPQLEGLNAVVIGRSQLVGKPMGVLLLQQNCTVTFAHSKTRDLPALAATADILVAAVGRPEIVRGSWIKPGAIVIDVGMNRLTLANGQSKLLGDVAYSEAVERAGAITPVPGGVGPMTIACLLRNTVLAACMQHDLTSPTEI